MKAAAIITAAGSGERMGGSIKKPYILLQGMPLLAHTLQVFAQAPDIAELIVTVSPGQEDYCRQQVVTGCAIAKAGDRGGGRRPAAGFGAKWPCRCIRGQSIWS